MTPRTSTYLRRLALAIPLAVAATFSASAFGDPAIACAAPREWDIGAYDACSTRVDDAWIRGAISEENHIDAYRECCEKTGGDWNPASKQCQAPPAEQAQEAERQPAPPPEGGMIFWPGYQVLPPAGPAAPPPSEAAPAP